MLVSLTVGKVDAGVAVLLTEDKRLIEFPSILLPSSIQSGSIVDITVSQNSKAEQRAQASFIDLQERILNSYGLHAPTPPVLRVRNATQTSIVLEWDPIQLATSTLRSLALYRDGNKAGNIPRPMDMLSTKISGLSLNTEYSFHLVLRTSGGTYNSNTVTVKTHEMTNLTGITITPGVLPSQLRESLEKAVERIGARLADTVRIDTTHFVCTEGRGKDWEKAVEMNIPVVRPEWIEGCEREGKIVGVRAYYLDADPKHRVVGSNPVFTHSQHSPAPSTQIPQPQKELPERPLPKSPESQDGGPVGEPGPEVSSTPTQKDLPPNPVASNGQTDEDEDEDSEEELAEDPEKQHPPAATQHSSDEESEEEPSASKGKAARVEDEKGEDMEDVAL